MSPSGVDVSPLQLKQLLFRRISVEAVDAERLPDDVWAPHCDLNGLEIRSQIEAFPNEEDEKGFKQYIVAVVLQIPNTEDGEIVSPYTVDIEVQALFEMAPMDDEKKRESLVCVNGGSVVIGAIREQVTQLTARSVYGPMTLPTLRVVP